MARATSMERIEKLRQQLEEAERKEQEREAKKAEAQAARNQKKRESLETRLGRLLEQQDKIAEQILETQAALDELPEEAFTALPLEVVTDDDNSDDSVAN